MSLPSASTSRLLTTSSRALRLRSSHARPTSCPTRRTYSSAPSSNWICKQLPQLQQSPSRSSVLQPRLLSSQFARARRRCFSSTPAARHGHLEPPAPGEERHVTFIDKDGRSHSFEVADGQHLMEIAQENDLEVEGACGGSCACSTCHVIVVDEAYYDKMAEPEDDENDMLDLAFGLTETSRLGCQVQMSKELSGLVVQLPQMTRNMQASDFK